MPAWTTAAVAVQVIHALADLVERAEALAEAVDRLAHAEVSLCKQVVLEQGDNFGDFGIYMPNEYERPTLRFCNAAKVWLPSVLRNRMSKE